MEEFQQVMRTFGWNPKEEELKVNLMYEYHKARGLLFDIPGHGECY